MDAARMGGIEAIEAGGFERIDGNSEGIIEASAGIA
jgi:hypothetical protein